MAEPIRCPHCHSMFGLPKGALGTNVICPACSKQFVATNAPPLAVPAGPPAPRGPDQEPRPGRHRPRPEAGEDEGKELARERKVSDEVQAWRSVGMGVTLQLVGHLLYLAGLGGMLISVLIVPGPTPGGGSSTLDFAMAFLMHAVLGAIMSNWVLSVIASSLWLPAPVSHGARGLAVACLVISSLVLLRMRELIDTLLITVLGYPSYGPRRVLQLFGLDPWQFSIYLGRDFSGMTGAMMLISFLELVRLTLFPFFLRAVALIFNVRGLAAQSLALSIGTALLFAGGITLNLQFSLSVRGAGTDLSLFRSLFLGLGLLGVSLWGALVLWSARKVIRSRLPDR